MTRNVGTRGLRQRALHARPRLVPRLGTVAPLVALLATSLSLIGTPQSASAVAPGGFTGINPVRVIDTRISGQGPCLAPGTIRSVVVAGIVGSGVPADAAGVAMNVTAVGSTLPGFITAWPRGAARPATSLLNYTANDVTPNNSVMAVGADRAIDFFANQGCPALVVDVVGWFASGNGTVGGFTGVTPTRLLDTRTAGDGSCVTAPRSLAVVNIAGVPTTASSVALNVTVTNSDLPGYVTLWPAGALKPNSSTLNFVAREVRANATVAKVGALGAISIFSSGGCPHVVVDLVGWFDGGASFGVGGIAAVTPYRLLDTRSPSNSEGCLRGYRAVTMAGVPGSGVPFDATAVLLNITVVSPSASGYVTAFPDLATPPTASNLNFRSGQVVANGVWVKVNSDNHRVTLFASGGCPHIVVDIVGAAVSSMQPAPAPATVTTQAVSAVKWPDLSDPAVMTDGGAYYVFGSNTNVRNIPVRTVTDLTRTYTSSGWEQATAEAMPTRPAWALQNERTLWAPTVAKLAPNFYVMYFAANRPNAPQPANPQCIGRAFASLPQGPYTPDAAPFTCGIDGTGGALDPEYFRDPVTNTSYLLAAFSDTSFSIHVIPLDTWGTAIQQSDAAPPRLIELRRALVGKQTPPEPGFIENPSMVYDAATATYLLAYSFGDWWTANYSTGVVRCTSPVGPSSLQSTIPWLVSGNTRTGPGGLDFFPGLDGSTRAVYASWPAGSENKAGYWRAGSLATVTTGMTPTLR